jgi:hypothetical protein
VRCVAVQRSLYGWVEIIVVNLHKHDGRAVLVGTDEFDPLGATRVEVAGIGSGDWCSALRTLDLRLILRRQFAHARDRCVAVRGLVCCAFPDSRIRETRLGDSWLKQFHRIAGGILDDDLFATDTDHDGVTHRDARRSKPVHGAGEILNLHGKSIPASGALWSAVGHWLSTAAARIRHTQNEQQITERQHGERRGRMQIEVEAKVRHIECNGCLDVIHNVTDLNGRHGS